MHLCSTGTGHRDTRNVTARVARFRLQGRIVIVRRDGMVLRTRGCGVLMPVHSRTVVMIRMIVADVLVDVGERCHRGREDQGLDDRAGGEAAHLGSLLRPCVSHWERRREPL